MKRGLFASIVFFEDLHNERLSDSIRQTERHQLPKQIFTITDKVDICKEFPSRSHNIPDFKRGHDTSERFRIHLSDGPGFEIKFDIADKLTPADPFEKVPIVTGVDEISREVTNVLLLAFSHIYLPFRDFPPPLWIAAPNRSDLSDMSQRKTHKRLDNCSNCRPLIIYQKWINVNVIYQKIATKGHFIVRGRPGISLVLSLSLKTHGFQYFPPTGNFRFLTPSRFSPDLILIKAKSAHHGHSLL